MDILTDELIEKGARAVCAAANECINDRCEACDSSWPKYLPEARAALQAVLPDVVEKCAQIAEGELTREGRYRNDVGSRQRNWVIDGSSPYGNGRLDSAASIRSLLNKEDGSGR